MFRFLCIVCVYYFIFLVYFIFFFFFFFSSRRRHTRWTGDWSSDVCSSDLRRTTHQSQLKFLVSLRGNPHSNLTMRQGGIIYLSDFGKRGAAFAKRLLSRSEERRVGKECRSRWAADQYKKKACGRQRQLTRA